MSGHFHVNEDRVAALGAACAAFYINEHIFASPGHREDLFADTLLFEALEKSGILYIVLPSMKRAVVVRPNVYNTQAGEDDVKACCSGVDVG